MTQDSVNKPPRFLIGIDLGTTNCSLAYVDSGEARWAVRDFPVQQLVGTGEVESREVLPSFHYQAAENEFPAEALRLPWQPAEINPRFAVGILARDHGASVVGRLIASAKSWLSHAGVDRTAPLLPWHAADDVDRLSPVEASSRYLAHLREAWDASHPQDPIARQDVMLTVPASFDEVARELTVQAAQRAGLPRVFLLEEPQAAFYAWINAHGDEWDRHVRAGQRILVCDIGGGTTDFTLLRVRPAPGGKVLFHRVAVGQHLILGGDNLDLALAHHVESRLVGASKLDPRRWMMLVRACRRAKEVLLGEDAPRAFTLTIAGSGSKLIGGAAQIEVTREEVQHLLLEGFLPRVGFDASPQSHFSGFREFGLPYAPDAAITRYLAAFLRAHRDAGEAPSASDELRQVHGSHHADARPDLVLFNGGFFESPILRERLLEVLTSWFDSPDHDSTWKPEVLRTDRLDLAVSRGAAYYGMVRRGHGVRISGGLAHAYYLGLESSFAQPHAVCLLPTGLEAGQTIDLSHRTFELLIRQPAEFPLYCSATRTTDAAGAIVAVDPRQLTPLPPIRTVLQSTQAANGATVSVQLHARLTEIGTLDIWCTENGGDRRWRLQFDVRATTAAGDPHHATRGESAGVLDEQVLDRCRELLRRAFSPPGVRSLPPTSIVKNLEQATALSRHDWPPTLLRGMWETLLELAPARRLGLEYETRWLSLTGFCLRPGYGLAVDDWRVAQMWKLYSAGLFHPKNELCRAEWWILWRRIAGGLAPGQQAMIAEPLFAEWRNYWRKSGSYRPRLATFQFGPHESVEIWRLLGSLELLRSPLKEEIGSAALARFAREKSTAIRDGLLFAIGRIAARVPAYGPLNIVLPPEIAEAWAQQILNLNPPDERAPFAVVQAARRTTDRYRDVSAPFRQSVLDWLAARQAPSHYIDLAREGGQLREQEQRSVFGESLPRGLRLE